MLSEEWLCKLILLCTGSPSISTAMAAAIADSKPAVLKDRSMCILPECTKLKYVDQQSRGIHDYCGRTHSIEGKRRGIQRECTHTHTHIASSAYSMRITSFLYSKDDSYQP